MTRSFGTGPNVILFAITDICAVGRRWLARHSGTEHACIYAPDDPVVMSTGRKCHSTSTVLEGLALQEYHHFLC